MAKFDLFLRLAVCLFTIIAVPSSGLAVDFTVDSTTDAVDATPGDGICATAGGVCTVRAGVMEANTLAGADMLAIPSGVYLLSVGTFNEEAAAEGDLDITDDLTITGAGPDQTVINAGGIDRVFHVGPTVSGLTVNISQLTIRGGDAEQSPGEASGGGILNHGATLTLQKVYVIDNFGDDGGGIWNDNGSTLIIEDSKVSDNIGDADGGGIGNEEAGSTLTVRRTRISRNLCFSSRGGGIFSVGTGGTTTTVEDSVITKNYSNGGGGGIRIGDGTLAVTRSEISYNVVSSTGAGGIDGIAGGILQITDSTIEGNYTEGTGGGVRIVTDGSSFKNTTINSNTAVLNGGGLDTDANPTTVENTTISGNRANGNGGGLRIGNAGTGVVNVINSTIAFNIADVEHNNVGEGGGIDTTTGGAVNLKNTILAYNFRKATDIPENCGAATVVNSNGNNMDSDGTCALAAGGDTNNNPLLFSLADNGGPVYTHALLSVSPAIDTGTNTDCSAADARGFTRPVDGDEDGSAVCDIGAFEFGQDCNENGIHDPDDITAGTSADCDGNLVPDECQNDADGDGTIDACDQCESDANKVAPGSCGCGVADDDSNDNGAVDCLKTAELNARVETTRAAVKKVKFPKNGGALGAQRKKAKTAVAAAKDVFSYVEQNGSDIDLSEATLDDLTKAARQLRGAVRKVKNALGQSAAELQARKRQAVKKAKKLQSLLML